MLSSLFSHILSIHVVSNCFYTAKFTLSMNERFPKLSFTFDPQPFLRNSLSIFLYNFFTITLHFKFQRKNQKKEQNVQSITTKIVILRTNQSFSHEFLSFTLDLIYMLACITYYANKSIQSYTIQLFTINIYK